MSGEEFCVVSYRAAGELVRRHRKANEAVPEWLRRHVVQLECLLSSTRLKSTESPRGSAQLIGVSEVAKLTGLCRREVQRRAPEFGGQLVSGVWVFDYATVEKVRQRDER